MIESMEILKDAASAAIYGAQAGNGVVLITTKTGAASNGTSSITYDVKLTRQALGKKAEQNEALKKYCALDAAAAANDDILLTIAQNAVALKDAETAKEFYGKLASSKNEAYAKEAKNYLK